MALFGDDDEQGAPKRSFLNSVGSFLMKWVVMPVAIILGLGLLFSKSEDSKNFADKHLFGLGTGTLNLIEKGKDFLGLSSAPPAPKPPAPAQIKDNIFYIPEQLANSEALKKNQDFSVLVNIPKARDEFVGALVSPEKAKAGNAEIDRKMLVAMEAGLGIESINRDIKVFANKKGPQPPIIPLDLPELPKELEERGKTLYPNTWADALPLQKISLLEQRGKQIRQPDVLKDVPIYKIDKEVGSINTVRDALNFVDKIAAESRPGQWANFDIKTNNVLKSTIASLINERRYTEAANLSDDAVLYLKDLGSRLPHDQTDKGEKFNQAIAGMEQLKVYATDLKYDQKLAPVLDKTYPALYTASKIANERYDNYNKEVATYIANTPTPTTDTPTPMPPKQKADATLEDKQQKFANAANPDYDTLLAKASVNDSDKNLMATAPRKKPEKDGPAIA